MDYKEHWRQRLAELLKHTDMSQAEFAAKIEVQADYVSRLLYEPGKKGRKNLGPATVRKITTAFDLPPGWFDLALGSEMPHMAPRIMVSEDMPGDRTGPAPKVIWPFKLVSYARVQRVREHFSQPGMPSAIGEIDRHLDILVSRWEMEMEMNAVKRTAA